MAAKHFTTPNLTHPEGDLVAAMQAQTFAGMAHWAGSGPVGLSCRECFFWCRDPDLPRRSYVRDDDGELCARRCRKFTQLMRFGNPDSYGGPAVPPIARACRHFEAAAEADVSPLVGGRKAPSEAAE